MKGKRTDSYIVLIYSPGALKALHTSKYFPQNEKICHFLSKNGSRVKHTQTNILKTRVMDVHRHTHPGPSAAMLFFNALFLFSSGLCKNFESEISWTIKFSQEAVATCDIYKFWFSLFENGFHRVFCLEINCIHYENANILWVKSPSSLENKHSI